VENAVKEVATVSLFTNFDHYNPPIGPDGTPYEFFEALRDEAIQTNTPIGWSEVYGGFWVVTGWEEAHQIQRNPAVFSSTEVTFPAFGTPGGRPVMLAGHDDPAHMKYRRLLQVPFSPSQAIAMTEYFRKDANLLIDRFIGSGRVDIVEALTQEVPGRMTAMLIGAPPEEGSMFRTWVHSMAMEVHKDPEGAGRHMRDMDAYWEKLLADRRKNPGDDVMSQVIHAEIDGESLTDEELYDFFVILLIGGIDNTVYLLGDMLWRLAWDKELRRRLVRKPELLESAIDEFLRMYSPNMSARITTEAVEIGGVRMEAGQHLVNFHPIINRDPRQFPNPDVFIAERSPNRHFALGLGIHRCLGTHLVRVEATVVAEEFMARIPEWELDQERPSKWFPGQTGGMASVPIVFPPGGGLPGEGSKP
jgi:cytochrome P450